MYNKRQAEGYQRFYAEMPRAMQTLELAFYAGYQAAAKERDAAFHKLKSLTKTVPASSWTPEYRELAELIHTLGRDVFYVEFE